MSAFLRPSTRSRATSSSRAVRPPGLDRTVRVEPLCPERHCRIWLGHHLGDEERIATRALVHLLGVGTVAPEQARHTIERQRLQSNPFDRALPDQRSERVPQRMVDGQFVVSKRDHEQARCLRHPTSEESDEIQ